MAKTLFLIKFLFAAFFVLAGVGHFANPNFFLKIMPPYLPWHLELVYLSGAFEILLGLMLLIPPLQRWAAWGLIALLIAVFPANIYLFQNQHLLPASPTLHLLRLPFQGVLILWAYAYTRPPRSELANEV
ncbi:MAG: DoxX family protein [Planctomycetota bacterium]